MSAATLPNRRFAYALAALGYGAVFAAFVLVERPGLGIGHFFYIPVCTVALVSDEFGGICAGVLASALYSLAVVAAPGVSSAQAVTTATGIRLVTYATVGALVGLYARRNRHLVQRLRGHACTDFVTGVGNVRAFDEALAARCDAQRPFSLVLFDVEGLRRVNDVHGHAAGDAALRQAADALKRVTAPGDVVARVGGAEFALLTELDAHEVPVVTRRMNAALASLQLSVTAAVTASPADGSTGDELFRKADDRLFTAKLLRANRAELAAI